MLKKLKLKAKLLESKFHLWFIKWLVKYKIKNLYQEINGINESKTQLYQLKSIYELLKHLPLYLKAFKQLSTHYSKEYNVMQNKIKLNYTQNKVYHYLISISKDQNTKSITDLYYFYYYKTVKKQLPLFIKKYYQLSEWDHQIITAKLLQNGFK